MKQISESKDLSADWNRNEGKNRYREEILEKESLVFSKERMSGLHYI